jgi:cytochrome c-type biogenesis protein CcmE
MPSGMDPHRKRMIRLTVALTAALMLATALIYVSFNAGRDEVTAAQLLQKARPGGQYILAGTVEDGSVQRISASTLRFRILAPNQRTSVPVTYSGVVPDPFAPGRAVMVNVTDEGGSFVGQQNSLTTKCPSKYKAASGAALS